ncbi:MAG: ATP-dependent RecD-like DNA helicase [Verrucomicrobiaceae bacterium]|nr:ATP-dependent RecD-like DNA helicase [Verrucomicrobiaceae bacterium]
MPLPPADPSKPDVLRGIVERVTFHNEESGYCILKVTPDKKRDVVTVIGKAPRVVTGERVQAIGRWEQDAVHGKQFRTESLQLSPPDSAEGMERYLGSGLIEGIGPAYAKRLIDKFGAKVFDIIENESARLETVEGIGKKRRTEIRESWVKQKTLHAIMVYLHQHGIGTARALRIYKTYGEDALEILRANPYRLAADIRGIGFRTADDIAIKMGIAADSAERVQAGLMHSLEEASGVGHCCLPRAKLIEHATKLLNVSADRVVAELDVLISRGDAPALEGEREACLVQHEDFVFLPWLRAAEQSIARSLKSLLNAPPSYPDIDSAKAIPWAEQQTGKTLADSQRRCVEAALKNRVLIITGGPGVGKTTILNTLLTILKAKEVRLSLAAPTGRAAKRMSESTGLTAMTLHRLLEYQGEGQWGRHRGKPLVGDLFVIDECSMIDAPLMSQFLAALPLGAHLLLVGDADQLPSVGPGMVLGDLIASGTVPCVRLTEIFRQAADSRIILSAHDINAGRIPDLKPHRDSDFFFLEHPEPEAIAHTIVDLVRTRLPAKYGFNAAADIQVLTPMNRNSLGTHALNHALQSALNPPNETKLELDRFGITFRVGDKIIQTANNYDKEVFNGDIGFINAIEPDPLKLRVRFDANRVVEYEPGELDELQLAYALTIHKSQGSEFPCVVIPVSTQHFVLLERSLIYTAVTRARKLVILVGDPKALALAVRKQETRKRYTRLREALAGS